MDNPYTSVDEDHSLAHSEVHQRIHREALSVASLSTAAIESQAMKLTSGGISSLWLAIGDLRWTSRLTMNSLFVRPKNLGLWLDFVHGESRVVNITRFHSIAS